MKPEREYYNWDKDTFEDFWDIVERIDKKNKREIAANRQALLFKAGKYQELGIKVSANIVQDLFKPESNAAVNMKRKQRRVNRETIKVIRRLYRRGESVRRIALRVGFHRRTVSRVLEQSDMKGVICRQ